MFLYFNHSNSIYDDFLDSASYIMDGITSLNDHILYYELILTILVLWICLVIIFKNNVFLLKYLNHGSVLEVIWTLLPCLILILIAMPSFRLFYLLYDFLEPSLYIKTIGSQWYWNYGYNNEYFESYMVQDIEKGVLRNLNVDEQIILRDTGNFESTTLRNRHDLNEIDQIIQNSNNLLNQNNLTWWEKNPHIIVSFALCSLSLFVGFTLYQIDWNIILEDLYKK